MAKKCFNKNLKEYKDLLSKYKSDAVVNAVITKYQYNNGTDAYPNLEKAEYITSDKSFKNYSLNQELLGALEKRKNNLKSQLGNKEITNKIYVENKTKIDKLLRQISDVEDESLYTKTISFANEQFKDIEEALNSGKVDTANITSKVRFLSEAKKYFNTYNALRYIDVESLSDKFKLIHYKFSTDLVALEKRIQEESYNTALDILQNPLSEEEKIKADLPSVLANDLKDINWLEYNFGALATSTNPILASIDRTYKALQYSQEEEFKNDYDEFINIAKEYQKEYGNDYSFMYNTTTDGKIANKYIISEIDNNFYEERNNLMKKFPTVDENGDKIEYITVSKNDNSKIANENRQHNLELKSNKKARASWYSTNTEYTDDFKTEFDKFIKAKYIFENKIKNKSGEVLFTEYHVNQKLTEDQYQQVEYFLESQFEANTSYTLDKEGNIESIVEPYDSDGRINEDLSGWRPKVNNFKPTSKWNDSRYDDLITGKDIQSEYYRAYIRLYEKYGNKVPEHSYKSNELIAMQRNWVDSVLENPSLANIKDNFITSSMSNNLTNIKRDENGNITSAGLKLLYTGSIEENLKDRINALETQKKNTTDEEQLNKINLELSKLYSSVDLSEINTNTTEALLNYMSMASKYELKHTLEKQFNIVSDIISDKKSYSEDYFTGNVKPTDNRIATRITDYINNRIYDESRPDRDLISSKIIDTANKVTSVTGLGLALKPALGNAITATFNNFIEGFGGQFYNVSDYLKGKSLATVNSKQLLNNLSNGKQTKVNALMDKLSLFEKFNPINEKDVVEKLTWKSKMTTDVAFILQNASEYYVQSSVALAMMQSHRIVNGEIINNQEYKNKYKNEDNFNSYSTFLDNVDFVDNKIVYKPELNNLVNNSKTKDQVYLFSQRIIGVNQKIHGRYTADDANRLQQFALGRMFQQFKRWASAGIEERFTKKHYDYRLRSDIEGRYVTMYRIVSKLIKEGNKSALNWNNLSELDKSNIRKMYIEVAAIMATGILAHLAKKAAKEMDDEDEYYLRKLTNFGAYMSNRTNSELVTFYSPNLVLTASNAPVLGTIKEMSEFFKSTIAYPFINEDSRHYTRGTNKGRLKLEKEFGDLVPIWKDVSFYNSLDTQGDYYFTIK